MQTEEESGEVLLDADLKLSRSQRLDYPFSQNHGSVENVVVVKETCKWRDLFSTSMIMEKDGGRLWHLEYYISYICIYIHIYICKYL